MSPNAFTAPEQFQLITYHFKEFCEKSSLAILALGLEKHGSWEWSGVQKNELNCFVTMTLTDEIEAVGRQTKMYVVEIWAESDNNHRFTRRLVSTFRVLNRLFSDSSFEYKLSDGLYQAWRQANALTEEDLTNSYISPRS